jgi:hypothetical protein
VVVGSAPSRVVAARRRPASPSAWSTSTASPPLVTGTWNSAPADARTHLGLHGSTESPQNSTAPIPDASATRSSVPALPGSATPTSTSALAAAGRGLHGRLEGHLGAGGDRHDAVGRDGGPGPLERLGHDVADHGPGGRGTVGHGPDRGRGTEVDEDLVDLDARVERLGEQDGPSMTTAPSRARSLRRRERRRSRATLG